MPQDQLRTFLISLQNIADISTGNETAVVKCCPVDADILGAFIWTDTLLATAGGADQSFDVLVNGSDIGEDILMPDAVAALTGVFCPIENQSSVRAGERVNIQSNNEQATGSTSVDVRLLLREVSPSPLQDFYLEGALTTDISTGDALNETIVCPVDAEIIGCMGHTDTLFATAAGADQTFDVLVNGTDTAGAGGVAADLSMDDGLAANAGALAIPRIAGPIYVDAGDRIALRSNNEQATGSTTVRWNWHMRRRGAGGLNFPMDAYFLIDDDSPAIADISTGSVNSGVIVIPRKSELIGVVVNPSVVIGAPQHTFDLLVNDVELSPTVDLLLPGASPGLRGTLCTPTAKVYLAEGDRVRMQSNNEQVAASAIVATWVLRPQ